MIITLLLLLNGFLIAHSIRNRVGVGYGEIEVMKTEDGTTFMLHLEGDPVDIANHRLVSFKVVVLGE